MKVYWWALCCNDMVFFSLLIHQQHSRHLGYSTVKFKDFINHQYPLLLLSQYLVRFQIRIHIFEALSDDKKKMFSNLKKCQKIVLWIIIIPHFILHLYEAIYTILTLFILQGDTLLLQCIATYHSNKRAVLWLWFVFPEPVHSSTDINEIKF